MKSAKTPAAARNDIAGTLGRLQPMPRLTDVRQVRAELVLSGEGHPCLPTPRRQGLSRMQPRRMHPAHLVNLGDGPDRGVGRCGWNVVSAEPEPELRMLRVQAALGWRGRESESPGSPHCSASKPKIFAPSARIHSAGVQSEPAGAGQRDPGRREGCGRRERTEELLVHEAPEQRER